MTLRRERHAAVEHAFSNAQMAVVQSNTSICCYILVSWFSFIDCSTLPFAQCIARDSGLGSKTATVVYKLSKGIQPSFWWLLEQGQRKELSPTHPQTSSLMDVSEAVASSPDTLRPSVPARASVGLFAAQALCLRAVSRPDGPTRCLRHWLFS